MKKSKSRSHKSAPAKSSASQTTSSNEVDKYLASVSEPARTTLKSMRATIRSVVPPETTEGISYMVPMFKYKGLLIGFAALHTHCSLFVTDPSVMQLFTDELKPYDLSKGTIRFPADKPLPASLLKKIVKARIAQNESRKRAEPSTARNHSFSVAAANHCAFPSHAGRQRLRYDSQNMEGLRISHYRILRRLGSGGMGEVYAAEDERSRRQSLVAQNESRKKP